MTTCSYKIISLNHILSAFPEKDVEKMLSAFSCEKDEDVASFLRDKAIVHEKKHISRTYLVYTADGEIAAYFTIAISSMDTAGVECSNTLKKKMNISNDLAQSYLVGQIGRRDGTEKGIGRFAMTRAIDRICESNLKVGCRLIRLDCKPPLTEYYEKNGFMAVGRSGDGGLIQMIRMISA